METEVYLAKGDVTDEIVEGSGVVCLLGDQRRNTSRRGTIFKAGIRLLLIRRIVSPPQLVLSPTHYFYGGTFDSRLKPVE